MVYRYIKKKPCNLTLVNNPEPVQHKRSVGEDSRTVSSGQSSPLLQSPFRTLPCRSPADFLSDRKGDRHAIAFYISAVQSILCATTVLADFYYCAKLCVRAVFAVARCPSVCHIGVLYPHGWRYLHISFFGR